MKEFIEELMVAARQAGATDLHFLPDAHRVKVQVRSAMRLVEFQSMDLGQYNRLTWHMRYWCSLPETNQRLPQSGVYELNQEVIRVTFLPSFEQTLMSWRIPHQTFNLPQLLQSQDVERLQKMTASRERNGLLFIGGSTGAGKTTVMYALLNYLKQERIVTIENPPEQMVDGVIQLEVNTKAGLSHRQLLKETLRADPDIIVIGEVRTVEELTVAYDAALSGHLTITTFHTASIQDGEKRIEQLLGKTSIQRHWCVLTRNQGVTCEWATHQ
ncbi:MAG: ATPase, T2SS/T4P/T4SS family [Exiguobacterium marinum]|uniref:ATPase, T2SS/T4P/T4SS family n=1 Tax=Exiguobacterium marinum TaxID=273528 RepID=A0ABY7X1Q6_9BACL|nr:ATPase, T2SS/T4P/T4SS family [Exiguobacterium marinum]WDH74854.1 ATPase, T2SS/T4P/T4SS family [Exiguobacterium marinum]